MDVTCQRCNTRYEFDDALVSSRGTTVKCTHCGQQFKVHRPVGTQSFDVWTVRTVDGRELVFRAMRELQAAIVSAHVGADDVLIPGSGEPRRLGKIDELESFFALAGDPEQDTTRRRRTTSGFSSTPPPSQGPRSRSGPLPTRTGDTMRPTSPPEPHKKLTRPISLHPLPAGQASARQPLMPPPVPDDRVPEPARQPMATPDTAHDGTPYRYAAAAVRAAYRSGQLPGQEAPPAAASQPGDDGARDAVEALGKAVHAALDGEPPPVETDAVISSDPPITRRRSEGELAPGIPVPSSEPEISSLRGSLTPSPSAARPSVLRTSDVYSDPRFSSFRRDRRPTFVRWIVGLVGAGVIAIGTFTLVKRLLPGPSKSAPAAAVDQRVTAMLEEGEQRLLAGDVDGAKDQFTKASGINDTEPRVARALARIEVLRTDLLWLQMRLLAEGAPERATTEEQLERAIDRADKAVSHAVKLASDDAATTRLQIDMLRLRDRIEEARKLVARLGPPGDEDALTLAALDLAEKAAALDGVLERLRSATRAERKLGRARALLVYALVLAGKKDDAQKELETLEAQSPAHPLVVPLRRFTAAAPTEVASGDGKDPKSGPTTAASGAPGEAGSARDFRDALRQAHQAKKKGELDRAEELFRVALDKDPGNSEALAGLADVARARGDARGASKAYEDMLANNPGYVPALVGLADLKWASGKREEALSLYRQVVMSAPGSSYAEHAQARIDAGRSGAAPTPPPGPSAGEPKSPPPKPPAGEDTPSPKPPKPPPEETTPAPVDTTDLPE
jgi:predicted Zn finger-like uncharacterized protein